jgi:hypothetical protein
MPANSLQAVTIWVARAVVASCDAQGAGGRDLVQVIDAPVPDRSPACMGIAAALPTPKPVGFYAGSTPPADPPSPSGISARAAIASSRSSTVGPPQIKGCRTCVRGATRVKPAMTPGSLPGRYRPNKR